jgi:hypothetical protein
MVNTVNGKVMMSEENAREVEEARQERVEESFQ